MSDLHPAVAALLSELEADPTTASVTFFPMGIHTHLMSDGMGGWNLEVHTTRQSEEDVEEVVSSDEHLPTEQLVFRMSMLAMIAEVTLDEQTRGFADDADAELAALNDEK